jgi:hypothetical protein
MQARIFELRRCRTQLYIATQNPSRPAIPLLTWQACHDQKQSHAYEDSNIARRSRNANRTSQVIWAFTIVFLPSSTPNIRSRSLSGLVRRLRGCVTITWEKLLKGQRLCASPGSQRRVRICNAVGHATACGRHKGLIVELRLEHTRLVAVVLRCR